MINPGGSAGARHAGHVIKKTRHKDTRSIEIDQYSAEPVKLVNVEVFVPKPKP